MKPGDHPEFFRFPAPAGRSRESQIVLHSDGRLSNHGELIEHEGIRRAFSRWIRRHPDDGRFILSNGYDWTYLRVEDTPFFVEGIRFDDPPHVLIELSDGTVEELDGATLAVDGADHVYCRVKNETEWARFCRSAQLKLEPLLDEVEGEIAFRWGGRLWHPKTRQS